MCEVRCSAACDVWELSPHRVRPRLLVTDSLPDLLLCFLRGRDGGGVERIVGREMAWRGGRWDGEDEDGDGRENREMGGRREMRGRRGRWEGEEGDGREKREMGGRREIEEGDGREKREMGGRRGRWEGGGR